MSKKRWTDEELISACQFSKNKTEVLRRLGLFNNSGNYQTIDRYIKKLNIDVSHFEIGISHNVPKTKILLEDILVENSLYSKTAELKNRLIKERILEYKCSECEIFSWKNKELILHLDHINGNRSDNRIENLRLLCPNCHSQTETYCRGTRRLSKNYCADCKIEIQSKSTWCFSCSLKHRAQKFKIEWPDDIILKQMVNNLGYTEAGRQLGVSDNSIRKRLKKV